jgi:hypothetical protein
MKVRTLIFATLLVLSCALTASAQGTVQCALKLAHAPELRGVRLGMTLSQLQARYPKMEVGAADNLGQLRVNLMGDVLARIDPAAFNGVDHLSLYFIDNRLIGFSILYPNLPWKDLNQFVARMNEALKLTGSWKGNDDAQTLDCEGFQVRAGRYSYTTGSMVASIGFKELGAEEVIKERSEKQREQKLQAFRP